MAHRARGPATIGASGDIAGWLGYVLLRGVFDHRVSDIVIGAVAGFLYLGAFDFLPNNFMISRQGHLGLRQVHAKPRTP